MTEPRTIVVTGASRGLGFASAARFYRDGWRVVAAMRTPETGIGRIRTEVGAAEDDPRLIGVQLDLQDPTSVNAAATEILRTVGPPDVLVNNAGISAAGMVEETPMEMWRDMFATHVFGPVEFTKALLPAMREAGRGRIILVSSQGGVRGMPSTAPYSAAKGALERWGEAMAGEIAPFGLGVTVLVTGTYDTEIITDAGTTDLRDFAGPYERHHATIDKRGRAAMRIARPPEKFVETLVRSVDDDAPYVRRSAGPDALMLMVANRVLPAAGMYQMVRLAMGLPRQGALRTVPTPTLGQRAMLTALRVLPDSVVQRLAGFAARRAQRRQPPVDRPSEPNPIEEIDAHG